MNSSYRSRRNRNPEPQNDHQKNKPFFSHPSVVGREPFFNTKSDNAVQRKLKVGKANDPYEREADDVANKVVDQTGNQPQIQQKEISSVRGDSLSTLQKEEKLSGGESSLEKEKPVQMMDSEEEEVQAKQEEEKPIQKKNNEEEEIQTKREDEEPVQMMESEEEEVQKKPEEKEESIQKKALKEEEPVQMKEEEEEIQTKSKTTTSAKTNSNISQRLQSAEGKGKPLPGKTRKDMENSFGMNFRGVNIHTDSEAVGLNQELGAHAFTHGKDVYFNAGKFRPENAEGKRLLAHELTHVVQQGGSGTQKSSKPANLQMRAATWLERRAWLSFFDHYIPRKLLNNYMDDKGNPITLSSQEMRDCNPIVDIRRSPTIMTEVSRLRALGGGSASITRASGWGGAMTNGSLGNFTIYYTGTITVKTNGEWTFNGSMTFFDIWDFDPKDFGKSGRSTAGEVKTRVGAYFIPGSAFDIYSVSVPVSQSNFLYAANWGSGYVAVPAGDRAGRSGSDIASGGVVGDIGAGPVGGDIGSEIGAQFAEDLN